MIIFIISGKLQTWSLIAHGIEGNPNDPEEKANGNVSKSTDTGSKRPTSDNDASSSTNISSSKPPANDDFDGSDNSIAVPLNHVHNSPLPANSEMAADSSLSILSTSVASSPSSSACAKMSDQNGKCLGLCLLLLLAYLYFQELESTIHILIKSNLSQESKPSSSDFKRLESSRQNYNYCNCSIRNYFMCTYSTIRNKKNWGVWRNSSQLIQCR